MVGDNPVMTEDSGQPPQHPEDESGYWERKAAEDAAAATPPEAQPNPQQPAAPPPYPAPSAPNPYAAPQYGPQYGQYGPQYGQPSYPPQHGWSPQQYGMPAYPGYALPDNPRATTALVIGLVSVIGAFTCVLPVLAAPVAWVIGAKARKEIRNAPQQWGGEGRATAGMVLGIIGTVLLALAVIALVVGIILVSLNDPTTVDNGTRV